MSEPLTRAISIFMGERIGHDATFESNVDTALVTLGSHIAKKNIPILFGCGHHGHAKTLRDTVKRQGGAIVEALPDFIDHQKRFAMVENAKVELDRMEDQPAQSLPFNLASQNLSAVLEFKKNMMEHSGPRLVFPGFIGTFAEMNISLEENDLAARLALDVPLRPIIVLNVPMGDGAGFYDPFARMLETAMHIGRANPDRRNLVRFVADGDEAIALLDAYEAMGPVMASQLQDFVPERFLHAGAKPDISGPDLAAA